MSDRQLPIRLRPATQDDVPFLFSSWLKSYKYSLWAKNITNTIYFAEHHKVIERLLKNYNVIIACNNDDPTQIFGFICAGKVDGIFCLHYIYVKHSFRNLGIGKQLLNAFQHDASTAAVYTHHTRIAERLAPKYNFVYHPYLLINLPEEEQPQIETQEIEDGDEE